MLRKTITLFLLLGCAFALSDVAIAEIDNRGSEDTGTSVLEFSDPVMSATPPPPKGMAEPMTFGAIALVIAVGGGILVRRKSN